MNLNEGFLVSSCGDGTYNSDLVIGRGQARKTLAEHLWHGTYEEAQQDESVNATLLAFDDKDNWGMDDATFYEEGEQFWVEVRRVLRINETAVSQIREGMQK